MSNFDSLNVMWTSNNLPVSNDHLVVCDSDPSKFPRPSHVEGDRLPRPGQGNRRWWATGEGGRGSCFIPKKQIFSDMIWSMVTWLGQYLVTWFGHFWMGEFVDLCTVQNARSKCVCPKHAKAIDHPLRPWTKVNKYLSNKRNIPFHYRHCFIRVR